MNLFNAWIKKRFGIKSPSAMMNGYEYEYDYLLSEKDDNKKESEDANFCMKCGVKMLPIGAEKE